MSELGDTTPPSSELITENTGSSNQTRLSVSAKKIIRSIFILVIWWVFAITNILPLIKNSIKSHPNESTLIFFIYLSFIIIDSVILTNNPTLIDINFNGIHFIINNNNIIDLIILIIWFVVGILVVLPKIRDSMENHSRIWSLALLSYSSFIITSSCVFCFTRNLIMWFDNQDIS